MVEMLHLCVYKKSVKITSAKLPFYLLHSISCRKCIHACMNAGMQEYKKSTFILDV